MTFKIPKSFLGQYYTYELQKISNNFVYITNSNVNGVTNYFINDAFFNDERKYY